MNNLINRLLLAFLIGIFISNQAQAQSATVEVNQDRQIDALLELKKDLNKREKNFKIQIYNGNRTGAENARRRFEQSFYGYSVIMEYETPNYKIWVGNFQTRLEADRALLKIKQKFESAFIFKPKK